VAPCGWRESASPRGASGRAWAPPAASRCRQRPLRQSLPGLGNKKTCHRVNKNWKQLAGPKISRSIILFIYIYVHVYMYINLILTIHWTFGIDSYWFTQRGCMIFRWLKLDLGEACRTTYDIIWINMIIYIYIFIIIYNINMILACWHWRCYESFGVLCHIFLQTACDTRGI
jgi:hypothetical protein